MDVEGVHLASGDVMVPCFMDGIERAVYQRQRAIQGKRCPAATLRA